MAALSAFVACPDPPGTMLRFCWLYHARYGSDLSSDEGPKPLCGDFEVSLQSFQVRQQILIDGRTGS